MEHHYIVFDIGGTKTRIALVEGDELVEIQKFPTPQDPEEGVAEMIRTMRLLLKEKEPTLLCGGAPGTVTDNKLVSAKNLPQWGSSNFEDVLAKEFGVPVVMFNDAELVALGEYFYGAGKGDRDMLYVTVSTGVGGAHIVDGKVDKGKYNAEIGHQIVNRGELEGQISGTAVEKKYGVHPKDMSDQNVLNELADTLAGGLYDNVLHWSPETIVLGGSMIVGQNAIPVDRVQETLNVLIKQYYPEAPCVKKAALGDNGGLYGGMAYLKNRN